jgi:CheY-like chemotaxis protein/anti-sigma regulatory factor (Ser/Thr protein kinase)
VRKIIADLKRFSRPDGDRASGPIDIHRVVESSLNIVRNEIRHRAQVVEDLQPVPSAEGDPSRLNQVLVNLLVNAAQAIPEGEAQTNTVSIATHTSASGDAVIEISDTGHGIPPAHRARIFDPFFTTKPVGVGTGLGLSICHSLVKSLGGTIEVESSHERGSCFRIVLPRAELRPTAVAESAAEPSAPRRARILIVDDEPVLGGALARALDHDVVAVTRGSDALARLDAGEHFDLLLCDLMMPEMTGMQLYAHLRERAPTLADHTILITGGAFTPAAEDFLSRVDNRCIQKPISLKQLRQTIEDALVEWGAPG